MKQLLSLVLALLPCLAWAQYPSNGNQKITLGEQTTADGLFFRGVAATDTVRKPSVDTMAYMLLDTTTNIMWHYKKATNNAWLRLNLLASDTASMLTNYYRSGRAGIIQALDVPTLNQSTTGSAATLTTSRTFQTNLASTSTASFNGSANVTPGITGTLPVANGGTNVTSLTNNGILYGSSTSQVATSSGLTFDGTNLSTIGTATATKFIPTGTSATGNGMFLPATNTLGFSTDGTNKMTIDASGNVGIGTSSPVARQHIRGSGTSNQVTASWIIENASSGTAGMDIIGSAGSSRWRFLYGGGPGTGTNTLLESMCILTENATAGNVGIGTASPSEKLHVSGSARITGAYDNTDGGAANVFVTTTGVLKRSTSSIKYKTEVEDYNKGLSDVLKLRPVTYKSINANDNKIYAGFIAEELSDLKLAELLQNNEEGEPDAISYAYMVTLLTKAIQEQQQQIENLKKRLLTLENK